MNYAVVLVAAGKSSRFASATETPAMKKPFVFLRGKSVWVHSAEKFAMRNDVVQLLIAVAPEDVIWFNERYAEEIRRFKVTVVSGGQERIDSVRNALAAIRNDVEFIAVHDAARPCIAGEQIEAVFRAAAKYGAALLASPVAGTLKRVQDGTVQATVPRDGLWEAQTPQVFRRDILLDAYSRSGDTVPTDDAQLAENAGKPVRLVPSNRWNLKITEQTDLKLAELLLQEVLKTSE
ncbi:MAG: 2-C-methyl-D-erythritol 4-phosphate cytidylyltransferase [Planctomycetaceae bacterium]|jgi:2-C-methyl-D-erythritol 4-phosphate cytidylyltransferase|nr:2-C-methyl-D-erythritol 4-phosphate cytidylyltransferase [Planctomycetaceae bacterium]